MKKTSASLLLLLLLACLSGLVPDAGATEIPGLPAPAAQAYAQLVREIQTHQDAQVRFAAENYDEDWLSVWDFGVALQDITGDGVPELFCAWVRDGNLEQVHLSIWTWEEEAVRPVFSENIAYFGPGCLDFDRCNTLIWSPEAALYLGQRWSAESPAVAERYVYADGGLLQTDGVYFQMDEEAYNQALEADYAVDHHEFYFPWHNGVRLSEEEFRRYSEAAFAGGPVVLFGPAFGEAKATLSFAEAIALLGGEPAPETTAPDPGVPPIEGGTIPDGAYTIRLAEAGLCLDAAGGGTDNGTKLQIWSPNGTPAQQWHITHLGGGVYAVTGVGSGRAMEIMNSATENGASVQLWDFSPEHNTMKWRIEPTEGNQYRFVNAHSGLCLDVQGGDLREGVPVQGWEDNGTAAQRFVLLPLSDVAAAQPAPEPAPVPEAAPAGDILTQAHYREYTPEYDAWTQALRADREGDLRVEIRATVHEQYTLADGLIIGLMEFHRPVASGASPAADAINAYYDAREASFGGLLDTIRLDDLDFIRSAVTYEGMDPMSFGDGFILPAGGHLYTQVETCLLVYQGQGVLSFFSSQYSFTQGVHPFIDRTPAVFRMETGEKLRLSDVLAIDEGSAGDVLVAEFDRMFPGVLDGGENRRAVREASTVDSPFYMDGQGVFVHYGEYTIGYAAGEFDLRIGYHRTDLVRPPWAEGTPVDAWSGYFAGLPEKYNNDLAKEALSLCEAAQSGSNAGIIRAFEDRGFGAIRTYNYQENSGSLGATWRDEVAYAIASRPVRVNGMEALAIVVVCRGTEIWQEIVKDGGIAAYFGTSFMTHAAETVMHSVDDYYADELLASHNVPVYYLITGHSLGGGTANNLAHLLGQGTFAYCFAAPNNLSPVDSALHSGDGRNIHNIINRTDVVCLFPSGGGRYGQDHEFSILKDIFLLPAGENHAMSTYREALDRYRPDTSSFSGGGGGGGGGGGR